MSDIVSSKPRTTRRALLGGLTLGAAAVVAESVRPLPASATQGQAILAGVDNSETRYTYLQNVGTFGHALEVVGGITGGSGLRASSSGSSPAVDALGSGNGVTGATYNSLASGVYGQNDGGGYGVAGRSNQANGTGVFGEALGTGGTALRGLSSGAGTALKVEGKATFSRSGTKKAPAGATKVVVPLAGVTTDSLILATLQKHTSGYSIAAAVPAPGSFTLWLNKAAPKGGLPIGWFVIN